MKRTIFSVGALCLVLAGCGGHQAITPNVAGGPSGAAPKVVQTGHVPVTWTQFGWGDTLSNPHQFNYTIVGPDKNVWYTDYNGQALIRMNMIGATHAFPLVYNGTTHFVPSSLAAGFDGKFYMGSPNLAGNLGIMTQAGAFSVKVIPSGDQVYDGGMVLGPDHNVWFTELSHVGKITPAGVVTEFPYADGDTSNYYGQMVVGPDNDIWVTEYNQSIIDDIEPSTGAMTAYVLPCGPTGLASANDGNLYALCSNQIVKITTSGSYTTIPNVWNTDGYPSAFTKGPDGNPWFTIANSNNIGRYNTANNSINVFIPPSTGFSADYGLTAGPDNNVWALDTKGFADVYILHVISVAPTTLTFTANGQHQNIVTTEKGTTAWTATTTNPAVATVAQGSPATTFVVTSVGSGVCHIIVTDSVANSFQVKVTVP